jgi:hypothetical protein
VGPAPAGTADIVNTPATSSSTPTIRPPRHRPILPMTVTAVTP